MKLQKAIYIILLLGFSIELSAQNEVYEGNYFIRSKRELEEFAQSGIKIITGDLRINDDNHSGDNSIFEGNENALSTIEEIHGFISISLEKDAEIIRISSLKTVDQILIGSTKRVELPRLEKTQYISYSSALEFIAPKLRQLRSLEPRFDVKRIYLPSLEIIEDRLIIKGESAKLLEELSLPNLKSIGGRFEIEGPDDPATPWAPKINLPSLENVGSNIWIRKLSQNAVVNIEKLEKVGGALWLDLFLPKMPKLRWVDEFVRLEIDNAIHREISFESLEEASSFRAAGNSLDIFVRLNLPKLRRIEKWIDTGVFGFYVPFSQVDLSSLVSVDEIDIKARKVKLNSITHFNELTIERMDSNQDFELPNLVNLQGLIELKTESGEPFNKISFPKLKFASAGLPLNAETLHYPLLSTYDRPLTFSGNYTSIDFSGLKWVNRLSLSNLEVTSIDFSSLVNSNQLFIQDTYVGSGLLGFENLVGTYTNHISQSDLPGDILANLQKVSEIDIQDTKFRSDLNLSKLQSAGRLDFDGIDAIVLDLSSLQSNASGPYLSFSNGGTVPLNIEEIRLNSVRHLGRLQINYPGLKKLNMQSLTTVESLEVESDNIELLDFPALSRANSVFIKGSKLHTIQLPILKEAGNLFFHGTAATSLNLGTLEKSNWMGFENNPNLTTINLSSLAETGVFELRSLPSLTSIITSTPGEDGGLLVSDLRVSDILRVEESYTCISTQTYTYSPALEKTLDLYCDGGAPRRDYAQLVKEGGSGSFTNEVAFPQFAITQGNRIDFGIYDDTQTSRTITIENRTNEVLTLNTDILGRNPNAYSLSQAEIEIAANSTTDVAIFFNPDGTGRYDANLLVNTADENAEVSLTGKNNGSIFLGDLEITADEITNDLNEYTLSGNVRINNFIQLTGLEVIDKSTATITGSGNIQLVGFEKDAPISYQLLYTGDYQLIHEGGNRLNLELENAAFNTLTVGFMPVLTRAIMVGDGKVTLDSYVQMSLGDENLIKADIPSLGYSKTEGLIVEGNIKIPGPIKIGSFALENIELSFNTETNEFGGGVELKTPLFNPLGAVVFQNGELRDITVGFENNIALGTTGWSLTKGAGSLKNIRSSPKALELRADLKPTLIANYDLLSIEDLGFEYTFGERFEAGGKLKLFKREVAGAEIVITKNQIAAKGSANMADILRGEVSLAVGIEDNSFDLSGGGMVSLTIPKNDNISVLQFLDGAIGLPYRVAQTQAYLKNNSFYGSTEVLGFDFHYNLIYANDDFEINFGQNFQLKNSEVFDFNKIAPLNPAITAKNSVINQTSFDKNGSVVFNVTRKENSVANSVENESNSIEFNLSEPVENIIVKVQNDNLQPQYYIVLPNQDTLNETSANRLNATYVTNQIAGFQSFYGIRSPETGTYQIVIESANEEYLIDVLGTDLEADIHFDNLEIQEQMLPVRWSSFNLKEGMSLQLFVDSDSINADGRKISDSLNPESGEYTWDISGESASYYWIYGILRDDNNNESRIFYAADPVRIENGDPAKTPQNLRSEVIEGGVILRWDAVTDAEMYRVYYSTDSLTDYRDPVIDVTQDSVVLDDLLSNQTYYWSVSSWQNDEESALAAPLSFVSDAGNSLPPVLLTAPEEQLLIAGLEYQGRIEIENAIEPYSLYLDSEIEGIRITGDTLYWTPDETQIGFHNIALTLVDANFQTGNLNFELLVERANSAPTDLFLNSNTIFENEPAGTFIGYLGNVDFDFDDEHQYTFVNGEDSGDNDLFSIRNDSLFSATTFDFETVNSYSVRIRVADEENASFEKNLQIVVRNRNEAPEFLKISNLNIEENAEEGTVIGVLSATDPDEGDQFTFNLAAGEGDTDNDSFEISGDQLSTKGVFDFEVKTTYAIRVRATDAGNESVERSLIINIENVAEPMIEISGTLDFAETEVGTTKQLDVAIENTGNDGTLIIDEVQSPDGFSVVLSSSSIGEGQSATLEVLFNPAETKAYSGEIIVLSNAEDISINATGIGFIITSTSDDYLPDDLLKIYPNPAETDLIIEPGRSAYLSEYEPFLYLLSPDGRIVAEQKLSAERLVIDITSLADGVYLLKVQTSKGSVGKKIIIRR